MKKKYFIGIDVGGTKISGALVTDSGEVLVRKKIPTKKGASPKEVIAAIAGTVRSVLKEKQLFSFALSGIGIGIPGIVDTEKGLILITPNINLSGVAIGRELEKRFKVKAAVGNDVNLGLLGEQWLGSARGVQNVIGLFPGTGVGGAIIINGRMLTGATGAGAELGHMIVEKDGPECACGNRGCLEAITGRWAIERDIRLAIKKGKKSKIMEIAGFRQKLMKSKMLKKALKARDPVVTGIMKHASEVLGLACVSLRHVFDPELIVFGGGVIEACSSFMLPVIRKKVKADPFFKDISECRIVESVLGDDAVLLGAVALIRQVLGFDVSGKDIFPRISFAGPGKILVQGKACTQDIYIRADGKLKKRAPRQGMQRKPANNCRLGLEELKKICKKKPDLFIIGSQKKNLLKMTREAQTFLKREGIDYRILSVSKAVNLYKTTGARKALLIHFS